MSEQLKNFLFSLTIVVPAVTGIIRFRNADTGYRPFLFYVFLSLVNELLVGLYLSGYSKRVEIMSWEIFNLLECVLLLLQFYYWQRFKNFKAIFFILAGTAVAGWITENFIVSNIYAFNPYFLISYSFVLVLLSVNTINHQVVNDHRAISKNAMFIICVAMVIFFIYNLVVFMLLTTKRNNAFTNIFEIRVYINALTNLLYAIGIYHIPRKTHHRNIFKQEIK